MDLGKSLIMAMAKKGIKNKELAEVLETTPQQISIWRASGGISRPAVVNLANHFEMKVSEFIALGEDD